MKKLKIYCLLALAWLIVGGCRPDQTIFGKCKTVGRGFNYADIRFYVVDSENRDYFALNPDLNWQNFMVYDENWGYPTWNGVSWETFKSGFFISNEFYLDIARFKAPYGKDEVKTFYFQYKEDIDTMRVEYKIKNECTHMAYIRVFYNNELLLREENVTQGRVVVGITKK